MGDVLHALPVLGALRRRFPQARIDWAVEDRFENMVAARPEVDRTLVFPRHALRRAASPLGKMPFVRRFVEDLRTVAYDAVLDLQGNLKSGVVTRLARARVRFGLDRQVAKEGNHLLTTRRALPPPRARHRIARGLALLALFLGEDVGWEDPGLPPDPDAASRLDAALDLAGAPRQGGVVLLPGTSAFGAFKRWPAACFHDLLLSLQKDGLQVIVPAPPGEAALAAAVTRGGREGHVVEAAGLDVLGELLRRADLVVAADTGPLHLAALAGTPVLGLYGPKDPATYGPWGRRADGTVGVLDVLAREDVACRPCTLRRCGDPVCMKGLSPDRVHARVVARLAKI